MATPQQHAELVKYFEEQGYSPDEIEKILVRLAAYDATMVRDALFASMNSGSFDIESVIQEALRSKPPKICHDQGGGPPLFRPVSPPLPLAWSSLDAVPASSKITPKRLPTHPANLDSCRGLILPHFVKKITKLHPGLGVRPCSYLF